jgi:hypothetical protein
MCIRVKIVSSLVFLILFSPIFIIDVFEKFDPNETANATSTLIQTSESDLLNGIFDNTTLVTNGSGTIIILKPFDLHEWTNKTPKFSPVVRQYHAMASIWGTSTALLFGGRYGDDLNDTWLYDYVINKWTEMNPQIYPPKRYQFAMSSIYSTDKILLFGGTQNLSNPSPEDDLNDTWVYDLSDNIWTNVTKDNNPGRINQHAMAEIYDTDKVVMFGGSKNGTNNETWVYDLSENNWTRKYPINSPSPRSLLGMTSIYGDDKILIFSGFMNKNDTWVYDLSENNWTQKASGPPARRTHTIATIWGTDKILLTGGVSGPPLWNFYNDTWLYDYSDDKWTEINTIPYSYPQLFYGHSMAPIWGTDKVIIFPVSCHDLYWSNETWVFELFDYPAKGTYTSPPFEFGPNSTLKTLTWQANGSSNTDVKFQLRSAQTKDILNTLQFLGPEGSIDIFYETSGSNLWSGHAGDRWIQYRAYLETSYEEETPTLGNITLVYNYWPNTTLVNPKSGYITNNNDPIFTWNFTDRDSNMQSAFQIIIGDYFNFNIIDFESRIINSTENSSRFSDAFNANNLPDGTWYWQVRTKDNDGDWGHYSKPWKYVIDTIAPISNINFPKNNNYYNCVSKIYGSANESINGTGLNNVEISIHRMDDDTYFDGLSWISTEAWLPAAGTENWTYNSSAITWFSGWEYNIRSRAIDIPNNIETPKPGNTFIFDPNPVIFTKAFPSASEIFDSTKIEVGITITDDLSGVNSSSIEYAISKDHGTTWEPWEPVFGYKNGNTIDVKQQIQFWNSTGNQLKWHASDLAGNGPTESKTYTINIINQSWLPNGSILPQVRLLSPANNSIIRTSSIDLTWTIENSNINDIVYDVYFDDKDPPVDKLDSNFSENSLSIDNLSNGQTYYWTVIPKIDNTTGTCLSCVWSFTVDIHLPRVTLISPENNSIITSNKPTFVWKVEYFGSEDLSYRVHLDTSPNLNYNQDVTTTYYMPQLGLVDNFTYYWKVVPYVVGLEGYGSEVWSFTVQEIHIDKPKFEIDLTLNPNELMIKPGQILLVETIVTNLGDLTDNFTVFAETGLVFESKLDVEVYRNTTLEISTGESKIFLVMVSVKDGSRPIVENITITAESELDARYGLNVWVSEELKVTILEKDEDKDQGRAQEIIFYLILVIILIIIIILLVLIYINRRKKQDSDKTQSSEHFETKTENNIKVDSGIGSIIEQHEYTEE